MRNAGAQLNTHQTAKLLAIVVMTIDHVGAYLYPDLLWLRAIGRLCVPAWFFLVGHGLHFTVRRDILLWALVLALLHPLLGGSFFALNVLVTISCCQWALSYIERHGMLTKQAPLLCFLALLFCLPASLVMEYGTQGFLFALMGYAVRTGQMGWRTGKLVSVAAVALFLAIQLALLPYDAAQAVFLIVGVAAVTLMLSRLTLRTLVVRLPGERALIWLSRHSLQYYVLHRVLLEALGLVMGVTSFGWHWVEAA